MSAHLWYYLGTTPSIGGPAVAIFECELCHQRLLLDSSGKARALPFLGCEPRPARRTAEEIAEAEGEVRLYAKESRE